MDIRPIKIVLADENAIFRAGVSQLLSENPRFQITGYARTALDAAHQFRNQSCNVLITDIGQSGRNGIAMLEHIKKEYPAIQILVLTQLAEKLYAVPALKAGVSGFLSKDTTPDNLIKAVTQVATGNKYLSPWLAQDLVSRLDGTHRPILHETLSAREMQTLCQIASGKTVGLIATELNLSVKTVSAYRSRLIKKLSLTNNAELIRYAIDHDLV
jgi:two-component system invasion response regulator UvrY